MAALILKYSSARSRFTSIRPHAFFAGLKRAALISHLRRREPRWLRGTVLLMAFVFACCFVLTAQVSVLGVQSQIVGPWSGPVGVVSDTNGNIYVAQFTAGPILKIDAQTHAVSTFLTTANGTPLSRPQQMAIDSSNNLYIADSDNSRIVVYSISNGSVTAVYSTPALPFVVSLDASKNIWVGGISDENGYVAEIPAGSMTGTSAVMKIMTGLSNPKGITFDSSGNLYVSDGTLNKVFKYAGPSFSGTPTVFISGLNGPAEILFDASNNLDITEVGGNALFRYLAPGYTTAIQVTTGADEPEGVAVDPNGNLFVTAFGNSEVLEISNSGSFGQVNVGSSQTLAVNFAVSADTTVSSFKVVDQGLMSQEFNEQIPDLNDNLCFTGSDLDASKTCSINVTFTPHFPGIRYGAVEAKGIEGNVLATVFINGTGLAPLAGFSPGTVSVLNVSGVTPALNGPRRPVFDPLGNLYVIDLGSNRLLKIAPSGAATVVTTPGVSLSSPNAVTLDGEGNLYIANGIGRVVEVNAAGVASVLNNNDLTVGDIGIAVDGSGNVYTADNENNRIVEYPGGGPAKVVSISGETLSGPAGVAIDGSGNLFIADANNNRVVEISPGGAASVVNLGSLTLSDPRAITLDASGNLYVSDSGNNRMVEIPAPSSGNPAIVLSTGPSLTLSAPVGAAVSGAGVLYIMDAGNNRIVVSNQGMAPSLSFMSTNVGAESSDSPQSLSLLNLGNAPLSFLAPPSLSTSFTLDHSTTCPTDSLAANGSCIFGVEFIPTVAGPIPGSLVLTDNSLGGAGSTQAISLNGTGVQILSFAPIATQTFGNPSFTVSATSASSAAVAYTVVSGPATIMNSLVTLTGAGTVTLRASQAATGNDTAATATTSFTVSPATPTLSFAPIATQIFGNSPFTVSANSASSAAVTYTVVSGPATIMDSLLTLTGAGTVMLRASQAATGNDTAATATTSFTVSPATPTLSFAPIATQIYGNPPFAVSATSTSSAAVAYSVVSGPATITGNLVTLTGAGTVVLTASQAASGTYAAAMATTSFTVTTPESAFTVASSSNPSSTASSTVMPGGSATYDLTMTPGASSTYPNALRLSVSGLPAGSTAILSPSMIPAGSGPTSFTLTVQTGDGQTARNERSAPGSPVAPVALGLLLLPFASMKRVRRRLRQMPGLPVVLLAAALSLGAMVGLSGCGANGFFNQVAKNYTVTVTATDVVTGAQKSTNVILTVQ